jgi:asparagine synthase (glutamine-hydrolysing)
MNGSALEPLEVATGLVQGFVEVAPTTEPRGAFPLEALERAILPALRRPPCLVSFSGGRDSSAILAVAARLARREGLPPPVPATNRFPFDETDETEWQERVVAHLRLDEWARLELTDELDCVGPIARETLRRHGLLWPFNAHFHVPLLRLARGGSLLTGIGGDEFLTPGRWSRAREVLGLRLRPEPRDARRIALALAPAALRRPVLERRFPTHFDWLRPDTHRRFVRSWAADASTEPLRWTRHVRWVRRFRYLHVGTQSLATLAADDDVLLVHPFATDEFATALERLPVSERFADRTEGMRRIFGELLPEDVLGRSTKTSFDSAFWGEPSRAFAQEWKGEGVDDALVDREALSATWRSSDPDPRTFTLAQAAWLARSADSVEQPLHAVG